MKKTMLAVMSILLILTLFCGQAFAYTGDVTIKSVKAYSDAKLTNYLGTIPAYTSVLVASYDGAAHINVGGAECYVPEGDLLNQDVRSDYAATLIKGTQVYQRPTTKARCGKLKKNVYVSVCAVKNDWVLVQTLDSKGVYGFVKLSALGDIFNIAGNTAEN